MMNWKQPLVVTAYGLCLVLFSACRPSDDSEANRSQWPQRPYAHVVGYCYDFSQDPRGASITFPDGSLHRGVIRATTVRLTEIQGKTLRSLVSSNSQHLRGNVDCYDPHHAWVFYDADWRVVASMDICFFCEDYQFRPQGASEHIDLGALARFCEQVGLPMLESSSEYTALFQREQASDQESPRKQFASDPADPFAP